MSSLKEMQEIFLQIEKVWSRGEKAAILMLMDVRGSSYRRPGAKIMISSDGEIFGNLSGGCLESDLLEYAKLAISENKPRIQSYDLSESELWGLGIGCGGSVDILILPVEQEAAFWKSVREVIQKNQKCHLIFETFSREGWLLDSEHQLLCKQNEELPKEFFEGNIMDSKQHKKRAKVVKLYSKEYVVDTIYPSEKLIVCGAGHDAVPVVELAIKANFDVTVLDPRERFNHPSRFPGANHFVDEPANVNPKSFENTWWIIMNHNLARDKEALRLALETDPKFVGVLGPVSRTNDLLASLDVREGHHFPIFAPIGLDLGAETVEEVGISIVSELLAVRNNKNSSHLKGKQKIHT